MPKAKPPGNAAGTRGLGSVLRNLFRAPAAGDSRLDAEALARGEARRVSCFLRSEPGQHFRQGHLDVSAKSVLWRSYWPWSRDVQAVPLGGVVQELTPREAGARNIKQGRGNKVGSAWGSGGWVVLRYMVDGVQLDLAVPAADAALARLALRASPP